MSKVKGWSLAVCLLVLTRPRIPLSFIPVFPGLVGQVANFVGLDSMAQSGLMSM